MDLFELNSNAKNLNPELVVTKAVFARKNDIISEFQEKQLQLGLLTNPDYTERKELYMDDDYADFKKNIVNPRADGFVDLKYEGDFYKGMYLSKTLDGVFLVDSTDWKRNKLVQKYGDSILFIGNRVAMNYILPNIITPEIKKRVENILFK